jgi:glycosyltransferase involved in cell wall biosynthesis
MEPVNVPHPVHISVVIPCFNMGTFVEAAVDSVDAQTFRDFEIVIVDDGSTDPATRQVLSRLDGPKATVIRSENHGLSAARNLGIATSRGAIICCLDADDLLEPAWFERGVAALDADPGLAFVSHWMEAFGDEQWTWSPGRCDLAHLLEVNSLNSAALVRREVFAAVGGFDESMRDGCEDWEFWIRVAESGRRGAIVPEVLYRYRRRPDSMSRVMNATELRFSLYETLIAKHPASYEDHLLDLILSREHTFADAEERAVRRIEALERSWSWRVTAPLRRAYEWLGLARRS